MGSIDFDRLSPSEQATLLQSHLLIGRHPTSGRLFAIKEIDRFSGTYILGVAGSGKSAEQQNMAVADIAKANSVIFIDPHGDTVDKIVATMPEERVGQTYVLDMLDEEHPFGLNLFATDVPWTRMNHASRTALVERTKHVVKVIFGAEVAKQVHLSRYLTNATILLLSNPGTTLYDMLRLFRDPSYRQALYAGLDDADVQDFWRYQFDELSEQKRKQVTDPLIARLEEIFVGHPITKHILSQRQTSIDFRRAIERRQNILIKLPKQKLRQDAEVVGLVLVAVLHATLFGFADLPEDQRPGFSLYIDEFQNFVTKDIEEFVTEGRKFGIRLTVAHQLRTQLNDDLQAATAAMRTKICFQTEADDATGMARYFPPPDDGRLAEVETKASAALLKDPGHDYHVRQFTEHYLRPLQSQPRKNGRIKVEEHGVGLGAVLWMGYGEAMKAAKKAEPITEEDPTQYLDDLLRDVMQTHNPHLPIPPKVVLGFSTCGHGFNKEARKALGSGPVNFSGQAPAVPRNGPEQLQHFITCLHMTMAYLAVHPIGKKAEPSVAAVAQLLTQLPRRHALVRSGDDVGRIRTEDTPPPLEGEALAARVAAIRARTRADCCSPLQTVEDRLKPPVPWQPGEVVSVRSHNSYQPAPVSGWSEVDDEP